MMVRNLLLLRHGHTKNAHPEGDFHRELKNKGKRNAQRIGVWLHENKLQPELILASPAERARTTAAKSCKAAGLSTKIIANVPRLYNAAPIDLRGAIAKTPNSIECLMVVAHNPGLSMLVGQLSNRYLAMAPATLVHLQFDGSWKDISRCHCTNIIEGANLPETFPFNGPGGTEQRIRPAYYYNQSGVVPYRIVDGEPQVLLISSSSGKHWVTPKGIHDPGMSAQESAENEAYEEAGVKGVVADFLLGRYNYEKWDATCDVQIFPMAVTHELAPNEWEESHRLRKWVSLAAAIELVNTPALADIIGNLPAYLEGIQHD
ncbi:NUDIX domain-containing protein [Terasakiella sp.]|uniref:NUDIX domain-containing protein n=1 Tax=Terasakiella sp. TaxID=2034861 RepID=UPI003AA8A272